MIDNYSQIFSGIYNEISDLERQKSAQQVIKLKSEKKKRRTQVNVRKRAQQANKSHNYRRKSDLIMGAVVRQGFLRVKFRTWQKVYCVLKYKSLVMYASKTLKVNIVFCTNIRKLRIVLFY